MSQHKNEKTKKWYFRCRVNGKNIQRSGFATKKEAQIEEAKIHDQYKSGELVNKIGFVQLRDNYYDYAINNLKKSTVKSSFEKIDTHIVPFFKEFKDIRKIQPLDIQKWKDTFNESNLSINYLETIFYRLSAMFTFAGKFYGLQTNPASIAGKFKRPNELKKEMQFFDLDEFNKFYSALPDDRYRLLYDFLFWTGCRAGEALALTWKDLSNNYIVVHIRKTVTDKIKGENYTILPPKTKTAYRNITIPEHLAKKLKIAHNEDKEIDGFNDECFIFGVIKPFPHTTVERRKNIACDKAGVKRIRIHDFRHSHATYLLSRGGNIISVSKRLGHDSPATTLNVYAHVTVDNENQLLELMNCNSANNCANKKTETDENEGIVLS